MSVSGVRSALLDYGIPTSVEGGDCPGEGEREDGEGGEGEGEGLVVTSIAAGAETEVRFIF